MSINEVAVHSRHCQANQHPSSIAPSRNGNISLGKSPALMTPHHLFLCS